MFACLLLLVLYENPENKKKTVGDPETLLNLLETIYYQNKQVSKHL